MDEDTFKHVGPSEAFMHVQGMLHTALLIEDDPEDTIFMQLTLRDLLVVHSGVTFLQLNSPILDTLVEGFVMKLAAIMSEQKSETWLYDKMQETLRKAREKAEE